MVDIEITDEILDKFEQLANKISDNPSGVDQLLQVLSLAMFVEVVPAFIAEIRDLRAQLAQ